MSKDKTSFLKLLLNWWEQNKRDYKWRHTKDPYAVLIAEMLLRKTTVHQVEQVYEKFLSKYPDPESLCRADKNELEMLLKPLGMEHKRAELFIKFGAIIKQEYSGAVPSGSEELLKLPGVGRYARNAVLSFVYSENAPLLDTNFIRVIQRVFGLASSRSRARDDKQMWQFAEELVPVGNSKDFNLAVLDLAALVCRAKKSKCNICPIKNICNYKKTVK